MADEGYVLASLRINAGNLSYQSQPQGFSADVAGAKGPVPGAITVATTGTNVDLSELTTPGLCRIANLDETNFVSYGANDPDTDTFYPIGELLPGESYVLRLSRNLSAEYGTGTGTIGPDTNTLHFRADTAAVVVLVEAFEI